MFTVKLKADEVKAALKRLAEGMDDMSPVMEAIGEYLTESTKKRFTSGTTPDGSGWAANSAVTLARKTGTQPLIGETKLLSQTIFHEAGTDFVEVGSNLVQAAMMQFGGTRAAFPHLWGDIPARPFLGLSPEDETNIIAEIEDYLTGTLTAAS